MKDAKNKALERKKSSPSDIAYESFASEWRSKHSISKPPSKDSWRKYYKNSGDKGEPREITFPKTYPKT